MSTSRFERFRIDIPRQRLEDLATRLAHTRWPDDLPDTGWDYGVPTWYLAGLAEYWRTGYDWRTHEAAINQYPQFRTTVRGQRVHFLHLRSSHPEAMPLLLLHGWAGSFVEFLPVIQRLRDADTQAFHLIIPSLPGFGFSGPTTRTGEADTDRHADVFADLMAALGYSRYAVHGGDAGSFIAQQLGRIDTEHVIGVHLSNPITIPAWDDDPSAFPEHERAAVAELRNWDAEGAGYAAIQGDRPHTLAYGLTDSPVAQLAWLVEHFKHLTDPACALPEDAVDKDLLLTNVSVYWFTATAGSSARIYKESTVWGQVRNNSGVPTGAAVFPGSSAVRSILARDNNVVHWSVLSRGGHFAAMEAPDLLAEDLRTFFRTLR